MSIYDKFYKQKKMKTTHFLLLITTFLFSIKNHAQHCPFDGTSIILIKIKGKKEGISNLILQEKKNPKADSCSFATGLISRIFQPIDSLYADNHWVKNYELKYKTSPMSSKGDYYVTLNMANVDCMIPKGNEYTYLKRHFVVTYQDKKTGKIVELDVPDKKIYSLCSSYGSWERIKGIVIKVN
jgi:hypothetical protein